jgi:glycosyltransferase involved in cell wall biosynthesis
MDQAIHLDNSLLSENVPVDEELEITFMERESINISNLVTTYNKDIYNCLNINPHILTKTILLEPYLSESHINYKKNSPNQTKIESLLITSKEINSVNIYFNKKNINLEILVSNSKCLDYLDQIIERIINFNGEIILDTSFKDIDYLIYYLKTNKTEFKLIKFHSNSYDILNYKDDDDSLRIDYLNSIKQADSITKNNFEINQIEHPLVSICIPTRNRSKQLIEALFSVEKSTYSNVEIIIVDDGSDNINHRNILNSIPIKFTKYPISIIEQTRNYPGYARNTAAGYSKGKYLFFLDDDNKLFSDTIESLVQSAEINDLHFITSTLEYADTSLLKKSLKPFLGNDISSSILKNNLGDTFSLIRRSSFVKLGGFDTTQNASYEDWELFSKAVLNNYPITTFPRALGIYNNTSNSYNKSSNKFNSKNQVINSYEQYINNEIKNSISYLIKSFETVVSTSLIIEDKVNNFSKTKFESSEEILLLLKDKDLFTYLLALENTEKLTSNKGLIISSPKGDPQVLIPKFKLEHTGGLYILIKVLSEKNDLSQLFYLTDEISQYNEKNQISLPIIEGENNLYFEIEDISKLTLPLRFDPGFSSSKFIIEHIEIRVKD